MRNHLRTVLESFEEMESINLSNLINTVHREFIKDTLKGAHDSEAVVSMLPEYLGWLDEAYAEEMQASLIDEQVQQLTQEAYALSAQRASQQTATKSGFRAAMGSSDATKAAAGTVLLELAHKYDLHTGMNIDEQTGLIDSFILDVEQKYLSLLEVSETTDLFNQLKRLNEAVCDKIYERDQAKIGFGVGRMANARAETDKAWRALRYAVNAKSFLDGYEPLAGFIAYMNVLVIRYKRTHLGLQVDSPEATPGSPETTPPEGGENTPSDGEQTPESPNPNPEPENPGGDNNNTNTPDPDDPWYNPDDEPD